jgi:hypothetical protein
MASKATNPLVIAGYNTTHPLPMRKRAIQKAIATVGHVPVLLCFSDLMYTYRMWPRTLDADREMIRKDCHMSLSACGYKTTDTAYKRELAIIKARNVYGMEAVYKRLVALAAITPDHTNAAYALAEDIIFARTADTRMCAPKYNARFIHNFMCVNAPIHLRDFGYTIAAPDANRRIALKKAINSMGVVRVIRRLQRILSVNKNKDLLKKDLEFCNYFV